MALNFPLNPSDGDTYVYAGITYIYILIDNVWEASFADITDATTLGGLTIDSFVRSDADSIINANTTWTDGFEIRLGTDTDFTMSFDGTNTIFAMNVGDLILNDGSLTLATFERATGNFIATGNVGAFQI
jgi:hypothetical protein